MNSLSFCSSLPTFTQKHGTNSRSLRILSLRQNFLTPKSYQLPPSKFKMQPKYPKPLVVAAVRGTSNAPQRSNSMPLSPLLDLIHKFYAHLNCKDASRLEKLFDPDCVIRDEAYYEPLKGNKVPKFFEKLTEAMGQHVVFVIDEMFEGDESKVAVMWHLEWTGQIIPFTRGCSIYKCTKNNETVLIRRAYVFVEAPFKPGDFALRTLKIIIALFDRFPYLAESFLRKPDAMVFLLAKLYKFIVEPLMLPIIMYYTRVWACAAKILATILTFLSNILKFFF